MNNDVKMICKSIDKLTDEVRRIRKCLEYKEETYDITEVHPFMYAEEEDEEV